MTTPSSPTPELVRFLFHANGHADPATGHLTLRVAESGDRWLLTSRRNSTGEHQCADGTDFELGGMAFVSAMNEFVDEWCKRQQDVINTIRARHATMNKLDPFNRGPGFRTISAARNWSEFARVTETERQHTAARIDACMAKLKTWPGTHVITIPTLDLSSPWNYSQSSSSVSA